MMLSIVFLLQLSCISWGMPQQPVLQQLSQIQLKLTNLQINLHHVLSKVVFLSDDDVHRPRGGDISQRMEVCLEKQQQLEQIYALLKQLVSDKAKPLEAPSHPLNLQPALAQCHELQKPRLDGVYQFLVPEWNELQRDYNERFCSFATSGPAWTVIQNRGPYETQESFNRSWDEYRAGFGSLQQDFWFGNEFIHKLTYRADHTLRIELENQQGELAWAEYGLFRLDSESYNYQLEVDEFQGTLPNALVSHNRMDFSTYDYGQEEQVRCAATWGSGWWFDRCQESNLNGLVWSNWQALRRTRMLIRPRHLGEEPAEDA